MKLSIQPENILEALAFPYACRRHRPKLQGTFTVSLNDTARYGS